MGLVLDYKNGIPSLDKGRIYIMQDDKLNEPTNSIQMHNQKNQKKDSLGAHTPGNHSEFTQWHTLYLVFRFQGAAHMQ
jgi:hypothetical protein